MKVALVNTKPWGGGAAQATRLLQRSLGDRGIDAVYFCLHCGENHPGMHCFCTSRRQAKWTTTLDRLPLKIWHRHRPRTLFSLNWAPNSSIRQLQQLQPDIVHLHWINFGFIPLRGLLKIRKPIVWTLHDSWPFTGGCHLPENCSAFVEKCGECPQLGSSFKFDLSRICHVLKQSVYPQLNLTIVSPSNWLADRARKSSLFRGTRIEVIPNGIDLTKFRLQSKREAKNKVGFDPDRRLIVYGAMSALTDFNKGFDLLLEALHHFKAMGGTADLAVFGADRLPDGFDSRILGDGRVHLLGEIREPDHLANVYAAADVMIVPSRSENLPFTVMESLACGTPVAAFAVGGIPELVNRVEHGILADPFDCRQLAEGIISLLQRDAIVAEQCSKIMRTSMEEQFSTGLQAKRYQLLYQELLQER